MGTQFLTLRTSGTRSPAAMRDFSAWNVEHGHVIPKARWSCTKGFLSPNRRVTHYGDWPWHPKSKPQLYPAMHPTFSPPGRPLHCQGFSSWSFLRPNPNPNRFPHLNTPLNPHPNSHPNPTPDQTPHMGPHFSPPGRSRDWCGFSPGDVPGPNPNPSSGSLLMGTQFLTLRTPVTRAQKW